MAKKDDYTTVRGIRNQRGENYLHADDLVAYITKMGFQYTVRNQTVEAAVLLALAGIVREMHARLI